MTGRILFVAANPSIDRLYEVDRLTVGRIHRPEALLAVPGGKGLNAARAAARLGGRVIAVGIVGGTGGDWVRSAFAARGIDARWIASAAQTRTCVSILDRSTGAMTEVYERGERVEALAWEELMEVVAAEIAAADVGAVALSGSLPPGAPPDGFGQVAGMAQGIPVLADTYGEALSPVLNERPQIVKVNMDEAAQATGITVSDAASAETAARVLLGAGAANVVVTLGLAGAVVAHARGVSRLVPPDLRGRYPVGSGDAFLGGMALGIARGDGVVDAARLGLAAGIANALVPGAGELEPDRIGAILDGISIVGPV